MCWLRRTIEVVGAQSAVFDRVERSGRQQRRPQHRGLRLEVVGRDPPVAPASPLRGSTRLVDHAHDTLPVRLISCLISHRIARAPCAAPARPGSASSGLPRSGDRSPRCRPPTGSASGSSVSSSTSTSPGGGDDGTGSGFDRGGWLEELGVALVPLASLGDEQAHGGADLVRRGQHEDDLCDPEAQTVYRDTAERGVALRIDLLRAVAASARLDQRREQLRHAARRSAGECWAQAARRRCRPARRFDAPFPGASARVAWRSRRQADSQNSPDQDVQEEDSLSV